MLCSVGRRSLIVDNFHLNGPVPFLVNVSDLSRNLLEQLCLV